MAAEWERTTVGDLVKRGVLEKPLDGNHGSIHPKGSDFVASGVPFIMASDLVGGGIDTVGCSFITLEQAKTLRKGFAKTGDVLLSHKATLGRTAIVGEIPGDFVMLTPQVTYYRPKDHSKLNNRYLKYYFDSEGFQQTLQAWGGAGSTRAYIGITEQLGLPITLPPLSEQKAIARILGTLDDKIELNRRMNATLEAMARALFQSWFVDAVPNDGTLPEGWEMSTIGAEAKVVGGSTPSTKSPEFWDKGEFHWVTPKDFASLQSKVLIGSSRKVTQAGLDQITSGLLPENTVLLSSRAPVGYLAMTKIKTAINQGFIAMICHGRLSPEYVMLWADSIMDKIKQAASGTTFAEISKATFRPFPIVVPTPERLNQFTDIVRAFYERIAANERQSTTLAETRDALLPRLLSGELRTEEVANAG